MKNNSIDNGGENADKEAENSQINDDPPAAKIEDQGRPPNANKESETEPFAKIRIEVAKFFQSFSFWDLLDPYQPWVLVPEGSFCGAFHWVPAGFRTGPWDIVVCMYLAGTSYVVILASVHYFYSRPALLISTTTTEEESLLYYEAFTPQWTYNCLGAAWTSYVAISILLRGSGIAGWITFTVQTWTLILLRHVISVLVPFFPSLVYITECLRLPMLAQSTITFVGWNLVIGPIAFFRMNTPTKRAKFIEIFTNFRLTQLHVFLMVYASIQGVWATPARTLTEFDLCISMLMVLQYVLFYIFVLDRLGIHLYLIFSPRTKLAIITWTLTLASLYGSFFLWRSIIHRYGNTISEPSHDPYSAETETSVDVDATISSLIEAASTEEL
jgi:hypothetical protein